MKIDWVEFSERFSGDIRYAKDIRRSTWYHENVIMPCTKVATFIAYRINITPNMLTALSSILAVFGMVVIILQPSSLAAGLINLVFLQLCFILDNSDGKLARLQERQSIFGDLFDKFLDRFNNFIIFGGFGFAWVMSSPEKPSIFSVAIYVSAASAYILYTVISTLQGLVFPHLKGTMKEYGKNWKEKIIKIPYQFMSMGTHCFLLSLSYILGFIYPMVVFYGILGGSFTLAMLVFLYFKDAEREGK